MTETEQLKLNKYVHTVILGKCWHEWRGGKENWTYECSFCQFIVGAMDAPENPNYCASLDLTAEVVKKTHERFGTDKVLEAIVLAVRDTFPVDFADDMSENECAFALVTSPPLPRLLACKQLWDSDKGETHE